VDPFLTPGIPAFGDRIRNLSLALEIGQDARIFDAALIPHR
jgi:hypothetical protein